MGRGIRCLGHLNVLQDSNSNHPLASNIVGLLCLSMRSGEASELGSVSETNPMSLKNEAKCEDTPPSFVLHKAFTVFSDSGKVKFFRLHMSHPVLDLCKFMLLRNEWVTYRWEG